MARTQNDIFIQGNVLEHWNEAKHHFDIDNMCVICLQGSQNYKLDTDHSDIDTKLIVTPSLDDIILARQPVSTTHVRYNNEHIDFKDIRSMWGCIKKQNINFMEILFTRYYIANPTYADMWDEMRENRELIAHYNPVAAVKTMKGVMMEKYHALEHPYPAKIDIINKYGFDGKQLSHLIRVEEFIQRYIAGWSYQDCLIPSNPDLLIALKEQGYCSLDAARVMAEEHLKHGCEMADAYIDSHKDFGIDPKAEEIMNHVQYEIMKHSLRLELEKEG